MSYARKSEETSKLYANICESLRASQKYKGYSILAGKYLMDAVKSVPLPFENKRSGTDWCALLKTRAPADYWKMKQLYPTWSVEQQRKSLHALELLNGQQRRVFLTFEGQRFQVSNMTLAVEYLRHIIPLDVWDTPPRLATVKREFRHSTLCVFTYGENEAIIERVTVQ